MMILVGVVAHSNDFWVISNILKLVFFWPEMCVHLRNASAAG